VPAADVEGPDPDVLHAVLVAARQAGFLGPGPIERHLLHAEGFVTLARAQPEAATSHLLDLGSGGGLPGLVIAAQWPAATVVLLEANQRRAEFLARSVVTSGLQGRVQVVQQRAELCGRDPSYRGNFDGVVVRSFGTPAVVAECAAPFLRTGGWLIVSEPPTDPVEGAHGPEGQARWPAEQLAQFGLEPVQHVTERFAYQILRQREPCPEAFPRRNGVPAKRPLF